MTTDQRYYLPALLMIISLLSGCAATKKYPVPDPYRINDFPTPPQEYVVEVLFPGEEPKKGTYIKTHFFEAQSFHVISYAQLLERIKSQAASANVDAVMILAPEAYEDLRILTAVGIKYKSNVDYLTNYRLVDQLYVFDQGKDEFVHVANMYPDFNNKIFSIENMGEQQRSTYYYNQYIRKYSIPFLLEEKNQHWRYQEETASGLINRRLYTNWGNSTRIKVKISYDQMQKKQLDVRYYYPNFLTERKRIILEFNEENQISKKTIFDEQLKAQLKEVFTYDEEGKLLNSIYYKINGNEEIPFLKTNYFYFSEDDIYEYF